MNDGELDEALLEEIQSDEPSSEAVEALERTVEKFLYVSTLLAALADWAREEGDPDAADLVLSFSEQMAEHEARTL